MATVADFAEPLASICVPVPYIGSGTCDRCHGRPGEGYSRCYSCAQNDWQLSAPCSTIVPVSLYEIPSQLHHFLRHYKSGAMPAQASQFSLNVVAVLCHFLSKHRLCIAYSAGGDWDLITTVPSTGGRVGEHPLVRALRMVPAYFREYEQLLAAGAAKITHNSARDDGFKVMRDVRGARILIVDDTFTSGARAQSAASALNLAGATVTAIIPVGRVVNPRWEGTQQWWDTQRRQRFSFDTCCLEPF